MVDALHQLVERACLCVAPWQGGHGGDVDSLRVTFDHDVVLSRLGGHRYLARNQYSLAAFRRPGAAWQMVDALPAPGNVNGGRRLAFRGGVLSQQRSLAFKLLGAV
jgi:hypothetical protein